MNEIDGEFWIVRTDHNLQCVSEVVKNIKPSEKYPMAVKIQPFKMKRSDLQNRYLWGWVYKQIAVQLEERGIIIRCEDDREIPYTKDILHEIFKGKFLIREVVEAGGKTLTLYHSTSSLNTTKFTQYVNEVKSFVWQFWKINVPEPHDGVYRQYADEIKRAA